MTDVAEILSRMSESDVRVSLDGDGLRVIAPTGTQRAQANSRVICRDCGAIHTLSTLLKALDERHERNKTGDDPQK